MNLVMAFFEFVADAGVIFVISCGSCLVALQLDSWLDRWVHRGECWVEKLAPEVREAYMRDLKKVRAKYDPAGQGTPKARRPRKAKQESLPLPAVVP